MDDRSISYWEFVASCVRPVGLAKLGAFAIALFSMQCSFAGQDDIDSDNNWARFGRTHDEAHYSPLVDINDSTVSRLGFAWSFDIPGVVLAASTQLEVNGILYFATGYSVVRAVDASSGKLIWKYDPEVSKVAGRKLRIHWGIRGLGFWNEKVYVGTHDGRLIAINAVTGRPAWSVLTTQRGDRRVIAGPPWSLKGWSLSGTG